MRGVRWRLLSAAPCRTRREATNNSACAGLRAKRRAAPRLLPRKLTVPRQERRDAGVDAAAPAAAARVHDDDVVESRLAPAAAAAGAAAPAVLVLAHAKAAAAAATEASGIELRLQHPRGVPARARKGGASRCGAERDAGKGGSIRVRAGKIRRPRPLSPARRSRAPVRRAGRARRGGRGVEGCRSQSHSSSRPQSTGDGLCSTSPMLAGSTGT